MSNELTLDDYAKKARIRMTIHAERAVEVLEYQLLTAKSPARIAKLRSRIAEYKEALRRLQDSNDTEKDNTQEQEQKPS